MSDRATPKIHAAIANIMAAVKPIAKDRNNQHQGFKFRGIDDVYAELHAHFVAERVVCLPEVIADATEERTTSKGSALIYRVLRIQWHLMADDGSSVVLGPVIGEGMDSGDKASNKAMSVGHKMALLQAFLIPVQESSDPDCGSHELRPRRAPAQDRSEPATPAGDKTELRGNVLRVAHKTGTSAAGKAWKRVGVLISTEDNEEWASTFSATLGDKANNLRDKRVVATVSATERGYDLVDIVEVADPAAGEPPPPEERMDTEPEEDKIPF